METGNDNNALNDSALMKRCRETGQTPEQVLDEALKVLLDELKPKLICVDGKHVELAPTDVKPSGVPTKSESAGII